MLIVTTIYCADTTPSNETQSEKVHELTVADLKDVKRSLLSVYQGSSRVLPLDGER